MTKINFLIVHHNCIILKFHQLTKKINKGFSQSGPSPVAINAITALVLEKEMSTKFIAHFCML